MWWDIGKRHIQAATIKFCAKRNRKKRERRNSLETRSSGIKVRLDAGDLSVTTLYHQVLNELAVLDLAEAKSAEIRSRAKWIEEGEASTAFFLRLEK
jgi:transcription elongation GreA/GreB family factor